MYLKVNWIKYLNIKIYIYMECYKINKLARFITFSFILFTDSFQERRQVNTSIHIHTISQNWYWGLILAINLLGTHFYFLFTFPSFIVLTFSPNVSSFTFLSSLSCLTLSDLTVWWIWSLGKRNREPSTKFWWLS